jgi:hypothetical protein
MQDNLHAECPLGKESSVIQMKSSIEEYGRRTVREIKTCVQFRDFVKH